MAEGKNVASAVFCGSCEEFVEPAVKHTKELVQILGRTYYGNCISCRSNKFMYYDCCKRTREAPGCSVHCKNCGHFIFNTATAESTLQYMSMLIQAVKLHTQNTKVIKDTPHQCGVGEGAGSVEGAMEVANEIKECELRLLQKREELASLTEKQKFLECAEVQREIASITTNMEFLQRASNAISKEFHKQREAMDKETRRKKDDIDQAMADLEKHMQIIKEPKERSTQEKSFFPDRQRSVVTLDVGGTIFRTTLATLCQQPDSLLARLISEKLLPLTPEGNMFLDEDPQIFSSLFNHLRISTKPPNNDQTRSLYQKYNIQFPYPPKMRKTCQEVRSYTFAKAFQEGITALQLISAHRNTAKMKQLSYNSLIYAGYSKQEIMRTLPFKLLLEWVSTEVLLEFYEPDHIFSKISNVQNQEKFIRDCKKLDVKATAFIRVDDIPSLVKCGYTVSDLARGGFSLDRMLKHFSKERLIKERIYTPQELKKNNYSLSQLKPWFSATRLRVLSSNPDDFLQAGFSRKEVAEIFSASALRQAGFSAFRALKFHTQGINLEKGGYKYDEVKEALEKRQAEEVLHNARHWCSTHI